MKTITSFKFSKPINLYCFTDVHLGAVDHDSAKFNRALTLLLKDKDGYCFFNGDTLEFIPPNYEIAESGQDIDVEQQLDKLEDLLGKIKDKVLFLRIGNHEKRCWNLAGIDPIKRMAKMFKIPMLHEGMEEIHVFIRDRKLRLVTSHGNGGASKRILANMQFTFPGADLYFSGHTHEMNANESSLNIDTSSGVEKFRHQIEMVGGSFLKWADYARAKNMRPTETGCYILRLNEDGLKISGKIV